MTTAVAAAQRRHELGFAALVATSALIAIVAEQVPGWIALHWLCKPLTTLLLAGWVWRERGAEPRYRGLILGGLLCSTAGDVFLMLPGDQFVFGLASFLIAHLAYLFAFRARGPWFARWLPFAVYALIAVVMLIQLWPTLPAGLHAPVLVYVAALSGMAAQAAAVWLVRRDAASAAAAIGAACFVVSDGILAWNRFLMPLPYGHAWVLVGYWTAQAFIARSVRRDA